MNRSSRESMSGGGRNFPPATAHHRLNGVSSFKESSEDNLDLFSRSRRSLSIASSDESDVSVKLGRLSIGSVKQVKSGLDDLLASTDGGKNDYDWLLTPPGTPMVPTSDGTESQQGPVAGRSRPMVRSISTTKTSRLSVSQSGSNHSARPTRSSSVTRPAVSSSQYSTYSNKSSNVLNTSSVSVSSYIRPSTPTSRPSSITRPSTPSRPSVSRSSTPSKVRPASSTSSIDKPRPSQTSRPSTPTSRSQISANLNSAAPRSISRPSTPTRRNSAPSLSPGTGLSASGGRTLSNSQGVGSVSRPSSPGPRVRPPPQPIIPLDFPHETPPNLRTTLPDRPLSAGRSRPGAALTVKGNVEPTANSAGLPRRQSSPMVTRGRLPEPTGRGRPYANGQSSDVIDSRRELSTRKPVRPSTENTGFGRNISKKSLDMAIRHMDIRNGTYGARSLTGSNLFPQSVRSTNQRSPPGHFLSPGASVNGSLPVISNGGIKENGHHINRSYESKNEEDKSRSSAKLTNPDIYESSRYDMILLKEDLKNTNWLHSLDDKSDHGLVFDNGFEPLPEPFDPL